MEKKHVVAVIGGACSGSETASQLSSKGINVVVFEQNELPYGKIEDGLPRWHAKLQDREKIKIDEKLNHELVTFVPNCKFGKDIFLEQLLEAGFSAVILASGAWKDRPLSAKGLDAVKNLSFCYQNPFIYWFNHYHEKNFNSVVYPVKEGAAVIGGGLASIDVVKVCQLETTHQKLKERGIEADVLEMEHSGIAKYLDKIGIAYEELGIKPACLYYRRRDIDMPLAEMPEDCTPEKEQKVQQVRQKILQNAQKKYFFEIEALRLPNEIHSKDGEVCGVTFSVMKYEGDKLVKTDENVYVETPFVVSSIGSIPEPLEQIPMVGETYDIHDVTTGSLKKYEGVYGVGNAVTGKGNINVSYKHARHIGGFISSSLVDAQEQDAKATWEQEQVAEIATQLQRIYTYLSGKASVSAEQQSSIDSLVGKLQQKSGYQNYNAWKDNILSQRV